MDIAQLTIHLPESEITFLEDYAKRHQLTISALVDRYVKQLQILENYSYHSDIEKHAGVIPENIDAKAEYYNNIEDKHQ